MSRQYFRAKPLQASKLVAVVVSLVFASVVFFGLVPGREITSLFLVPVLGLALVVVVGGETLLAGYRALRADGPVTERVAARPLYAGVRAMEVVLVVLAVVAFGVLVAVIPDGPMAGPGAVGVFFVVLGLGALVLVGCLVRTLTEYYYFHRTTVT